MFKVKTKDADLYDFYNLVYVYTKMWTLNKNYEDGVSVLNKIYRINEVSVGMPNFQENN